jgi:FixJ family two-component response regulator
LPGTQLGGLCLVYSLRVTDKYSALGTCELPVLMMRANVSLATLSPQERRAMNTYMTTTSQGARANGLRVEADAPIVFVVDEDVSVRESLELLIETSGWDVETFPSAQEFLERRRPTVPSCLILDVSLPGGNSLELQKRVAIDRPDMPIIFISGHQDVPLTVQAMKAGAVEFLTKPFRDDVLLDAIRGAHERSRRALEHQAKLKGLRDSYAELTPREREVMLLVVSGLLNKQVGGELGISEITVKAHRGQVMRKMKADSLPALVHMVSRLGLATEAAA